MGQIEIKNLEIFARHGVLSEETALGQKFIISVVLNLDITAAGKSDELSKSVNYAEVCSLIAEFNKNHTFKLIESAAHGIAVEILKSFPTVNKVSVEVKKPNPPIHMHFDYVAVKTEIKRHTAYISFGSNMGDREQYIKNAVEALENDEMCIVKKVSSLIETEPYGDVEQDNFLNGCMEIQTLYSPHELLDKFHEIENANGRVREVRWGPRTLDLDIVLYDDIIMSDKTLTIPHTDMQNRAFVLNPLKEIAPYVVHPVSGKNISELSSFVNSKQ